MPPPKALDKIQHPIKIQIKNRRELPQVDNDIYQRPSVSVLSHSETLGALPFGKKIKVPLIIAAIQLLH